MKSTRQPIYSATIAILSLLVVTASFALDNAPPVVWKSDPALASQLAGATPVGVFSIQPPQGFVAEKHLHEKVASYIFEGQAHDNGYKPMLTVAIMDFDQQRED